MKIEMDLKEEVVAKMKEIAEGANIPIDAAAEIILSNFAIGSGGRIFSGDWHRGNDDENKGFRYVVQWPFQPGMDKRRGNEVDNWRK